jgi:hypothetical protein
MQIPNGEPAGPETGIAQACAELHVGPGAEPASGSPPSAVRAHATAGAAAGGASVADGAQVPVDEETEGADAEPFAPVTGVQVFCGAGVVGPFAVQRRFSVAMPTEHWMGPASPARQLHDDEQSAGAPTGSAIPVAWDAP